MYIDEGTNKLLKINQIKSNKQNKNRMTFSKHNNNLEEKTDRTK
jgi:hypothetical protein